MCPPSFPWWRLALNRVQRSKTKSWGSVWNSTRNQPPRSCCKLSASSRPHPRSYKIMLRLYWFDSASLLSAMPTNMRLQESYPQFESSHSQIKFDSLHRQYRLATACTLSFLLWITFLTHPMKKPTETICRPLQFVRSLGAGFPSLSHNLRSVAMIYGTSPISSEASLLSFCSSHRLAKINEHIHIKV